MMKMRQKGKSREMMFNIYGNEKRIMFGNSISIHGMITTDL